MIFACICMPMCVCKVLVDKDHNFSLQRHTEAAIFSMGCLIAPCLRQDTEFDSRPIK